LSGRKARSAKDTKKNPRLKSNLCRRNHWDIHLTCKTCLQGKSQMNCVKSTAEKEKMGVMP
jgi:hypothetical protein